MVDSKKHLPEGEYLFRRIFDTCPDPININRLRDGKFVLVNRKFLELAGYTKDEVVDRTALELNIWQDINARSKFFEELLEKGEVNDFEADFRDKKGRMINTLVSATLLTYQNEPHLLAVTRDVTDLKNAEMALLEANYELKKRYKVSSEKLRESEDKYFSLVDALLTGVYICLENKITFVNRQFAEMYGYRREELLGMDILDLIHPEDRESAKSICGISGPGDPAYEARGLTKNGDIIYLLGRNTIISYDGRQAFLGNVVNISTRKKAEQKRRKSEDELRILSNKLLSAEENERKRIAGDIHDSIGQILSAIKFTVESALLALDEQSLPSARSAMEKVIPQAQQAIDEVRRIVMDLRPSSLDDLGLKATVSWFCREFNSIYTGIRVENILDFEEKDVPGSLKTVLYRILQEALNNAAKYSGADLVHLKIHKTGKGLEMSVEDNGSGFDVEEFQAKNSNDRGMGIASMKERTLLSGGSFALWSGKGEGTAVQTFWPDEVLRGS